MPVVLRPFPGPDATAGSHRAPPTHFSRCSLSAAKNDSSSKNRRRGDPSTSRYWRNSCSTLTGTPASGRPAVGWGRGRGKQASERAGRTHGRWGRRVGLGGVEARACRRGPGEGAQRHVGVRTSRCGDPCAGHHTRAAPTLTRTRPPTPPTVPRTLHHGVGVVPQACGGRTHVTGVLGVDHCHIARAVPQVWVVALQHPVAHILRRGVGRGRRAWAWRVGGRAAAATASYLLPVRGGDARVGDQLTDQRPPSRGRVHAARRAVEGLPGNSRGGDVSHRTQAARCHSRSPQAARSQPAGCRWAAGRAWPAAEAAPVCRRRRSRQAAGAAVAATARGRAATGQGRLQAAPW